VTFSIPNGIIAGKLQGFSVLTLLSKFLEKSGLNPENTEGLAALILVVSTCNCFS
jgi:hypothetical protein